MTGLRWTHKTTEKDGWLLDKRFLILDRDSRLTQQFRRILADAGVRVVPTAFQAPNMNSIAERFVGSIKRECLCKLILFGETRRRNAIREFVEHYNEERPHQGVGNKLLSPSGVEPNGSGDVVVDERLGGIRRSDRRAA